MTAESTWTGVLLGAERHQSPEWHALRARGLGGSEIAAVVGLSPFTSRFALWHRKRGTLPEETANNNMSWGIHLEPLLCDYFAELHPEFWSMEAGTLCHNERSWQIANVDRLLYPTTDVTAKTAPLGLLEVKTAHQYDAHEWGAHGSDEIPPYYKCQTLWYLDTLGLQTAHLAVLIGGSDYREYVIHYDAEQAAWLRAEGEAFWTEVVEGTVPPIDGHDATYQAVRALHPEINGEDVEIPADLYDAYRATKADEDAAATEHQRIKAEVLDVMGQAQRALVGDTAVLRRQKGRGDNVALHPIPQPKNKKASAA